MVDIAQMRADTESFLQEWGEALLRRRSTVTYDAARVATESWDSSLSFTGDFQPLAGKALAVEAGMEHHSDHEIIAEYDVDVVQGDRVIRGSDTYRVNRIADYEEHRSIFCYRELA